MSVTYAFTFGRVEGPWFENFPPGEYVGYQTCWVARIPGVAALCVTRWNDTRITCQTCGEKTWDANYCVHCGEQL